MKPILEWRVSKHKKLLDKKVNYHLGIISKTLDQFLAVDLRSPLF